MRHVPPQPADIRMVDVGRGAAANVRPRQWPALAADHRTRGVPGTRRAVRAAAERPEAAGDQLRRPGHRRVHAIPTSPKAPGPCPDHHRTAGRARPRPGRRPRGLPRWCGRAATGSAGARPGPEARARGHPPRLRRRARLPPGDAVPGDAAPLPRSGLLPAERRPPLRGTDPAGPRCGSPRDGGPVPAAVGHGYLGQLYAVSGWSSLPWLHTLRQPTLVLAGDDDPIIPLVNARMMAWRIPDARLHVVQGGGHLFFLEQPRRHRRRRRVLPVSRRH